MLGSRPGLEEDHTCGKPVASCLLKDMGHRKVSNYAFFSLKLPRLCCLTYLLEEVGNSWEPIL